MVKVWRYWIVRPKTPLLLAQFTLDTAVILDLAWGRQVNAPAEPFHETLGMLLLFLLPQFCFDFEGLEALIADSSLLPFLSKILFSLGTGLILALSLFRIFPNLFPGLKEAIAAVGLSTLLLLCLRPFLLWLVRHKEFAEGLIILGSEEAAETFYLELVNGKNTRASEDFGESRVLAPVAVTAGSNGSQGEIVVNYDRLGEMALQNRISRIVVAEPNMHNSEALSVALLDCKFRGVEVEQAAESYEKFNGKLWLEGLQPESLIYSQGF